ncbi:agc kinase [Cystoisospora suis]|uniref:Agc kinase n=1 Tax=Cystoisospora suis TaxID=483139 RepID=A0A2C6L6B8_9APIC|nr:agc kinase [Cystoisospora suis]
MQNRRRFLFRFLFSRDKHLNTSASAPVEPEAGRSRFVSAPVYLHPSSNDLSPTNDSRRRQHGRPRTKSSLPSIEPAQEVLRNTPTDPLPLGSCYSGIEPSAFEGDIPRANNIASSSSASSFSTSTTRSCSMKNKHPRERNDKEHLHPGKEREEEKDRKEEGESTGHLSSSATSPSGATTTTTTAPAPPVPPPPSCCTAKRMGPVREEEEEDERYIGPYEKLQEITLKRKSIIWLCRRRKTVPTLLREVHHPPCSSSTLPGVEEESDGGEKRQQTSGAACSNGSTCPTSDRDGKMTHVFSSSSCSSTLSPSLPSGALKDGGVVGCPSPAISGGQSGVDLSSSLGPSCVDDTTSGCTYTQPEAAGPPRDDDGGNASEDRRQHTSPHNPCSSSDPPSTILSSAERPPALTPERPPGVLKAERGEEEEETLYAVKGILKSSVVTQKQAEHLWNERQLSEAIRGMPEIQCSTQKFVETLKTSTSIYFVFEVVTGGPLHRHIRFEGGFPCERVRWYSAELVLILEALHARGILYRDLQASNILLSHDGRLKLVDFGLSKDLSTSRLKRTRSYCGTLHAMAPEMMAAEDEIHAGEKTKLGMPCSLRNHSISELARRSPGSLTFPRDRRVPDEAKDLIIRLLQADPERRLGRNGAAEVKSHAFFKNLDWELADRIRQASRLTEEDRQHIPEVEKGLGIHVRRRRSSFDERMKSKNSLEKAADDPFADF